MRWRDIRFEKPTKADGDQRGDVFMLHSDETVGVFGWWDVGDTVAWMPLSELPKFNPIPDPPEGWRFVEKGEPIDKRAQWWDRINDRWDTRAFPDGEWLEDDIYIVPINPKPKPEPKYRPFKDAAEFEPHRDKWIKNPGTGCVRRVDHYNDIGAGGMSWESLLRNRVFVDGTPCGVEVVE
jgi:hypothetical protein